MACLSADLGVAPHRQAPWFGPVQAIQPSSVYVRLVPWRARGGVDAVTVDQLVAHLAQCRRRLRELQHENRVLTESHAPLMAENKYLRKHLKRTKRSRDMWRARCSKTWTRSSVPAVQLRPGDLERILEMPVRD